MSDKFIPNSFQTPNALVDELMIYLTGDEWKVLIYMTRHILGFQDRIAQRRGHISLSMFVKGNGSYPGCGLGQTAVRTSLEALAKFKIIKAIDKPTAKGQLWELGWDSPEIDYEALKIRASEWSEAGKKRTAKARSVRHKGSVPHNSSLMSDIIVPLCVDINNQTHSSNTPSIAPNGDAGVEKPKAIRERNPVFDAVAQYVFEIAPDEIKAEGGRIGILAAWLNGKSDGVQHGKSRVTVGFISAPAKPEHVIAFAGYWKSTSKANIPYDLQKFVDAWRKWVSQMKTNGVRREQQNGTTISEVKLSDSEVEARKQQLAAARKGEPA